MSDSPWRLLGSLLKPHRRAVASYGLVLALATALPLLGSLLLARFVTLAARGAPISGLVVSAAGYATVGLVASAVTVAVTWRATSLAWLMTDRLRHTLADQVLRAGLGFHRDRTPGELVTRVDADVTAMTQFLSQVVARVISVVVLGVACIAVLFVLEPRLAPVLGLGLGLIAWTTWSQRNDATDVTVVERAAEADLMGTAEQLFAGAEDVASLGAGAHGLAHIARRADTVVRATRGRVRTQMRVQAGIRVSAVVAEVLMIGGGALMMQRGWFGIGRVFLGYRFVRIVRQPVEGLAWRLQEAQGASGAAHRVLDLLAATRRRDDPPGRLPDGPLDLRFEGVELVYDDAEEGAAAIGRLDLHIPAGRVVGLVGRSGSGKTTLARLTLGLLAPTRGRVLVGGVDLARVGEDDLRRRIGAVPQDVQLFPASVGDNVDLFAGRPPGEVRAALVTAGLGPWVDAQAEGLGTALGSEGRDEECRAGLSAGEAQLLTLARALLRSPDLVVLDEATSRVDPATQASIAQATAAVVRGRTSLIIAHRLATLDVCDDIVVMAGGAVVEHGERRVLAADPTSRFAALLAAADADGHVPS